jgi:hypothetical protein
MQCVWAAVSPGIKWHKPEADHSSPFYAGIKNDGAVSPFTYIFSRRSVEIV